MVSVLGRWELDFHAPITEQYYWSFALREFGVVDWHMTPVSGICNAEPKVPLTEWESYDAFFAANPDRPRVFLEHRTQRYNPETVWLHEFEHPEDCIYVFGSAHYNPSLNHCRESDVVVSVKTVQDKGVAWANQIASIVLYDRMMKA